MNERLKYRIWDKKAKSYTNSIGYPGASFHCVSNYYLSPDGEIVDFVTTIGGNQDDATKGPVDQDDYIVAFNTGMKDKNGITIFEGDIVQYNQNSSYDNMNFIAKWSDDKLGFIFQSNSGDELLNQTPHLNRFKHLEVVGNIFENPELLK